MKMPLREDDALIRKMLLKQWHLEATGIQFIPIGNSYSYQVEALANGLVGLLCLSSPIDELSALAPQPAS